CKRHKLRPNSVPSQNLPKRVHDMPESSPKKRQKLARQERAKQRKHREVIEHHSSEENAQDSTDDNEVENHCHQ
ncbi:Replication factor C large subunit, partial [Frankliniella fusca]